MAVEFDGADDKIACGTDDILQENAALTISAWINPDTDHLGAILARRNNTGGGNVRFSTDNVVPQSLYFLAAGGTSLVRKSATLTITPGVWQHVLVTWDGSVTATNVHLYINGIEQSYATTTNGVSIVNNAGGTTNIGLTEPTFNPFNGKISEVAYWNIELNAQEIANLASSRVKRMPLQIRPASLVAYWALDEQPNGTSGDGDIFVNLANPGKHNGTGSDGANNTGLTCLAEEVLSYNDFAREVTFETAVAPPVAATTGIMTTRTGWWGDL